MITIWVALVRDAVRIHVRADQFIAVRIAFVDIALIGNAVVVAVLACTITDVVGVVYLITTSLEQEFPMPL